MTKENLIYLGACAIMSSSPYSTLHQDGTPVTAAGLTA